MPSFTHTPDNLGHNTRSISSHFENLRISVLRKASKISRSVNSVTIGPNCAENGNESQKENIENTPNNYNLNSSSRSSEKLTSRQSSSSCNDITFSIKKLLLENELQRREEVKRAIDERKQHMEKSKRDLQLEMALLREVSAVKREEEEAAELAKLEAEEERLAQQNEIKRQHEQQLHAQRLQERKERLKREAKEHRELKEREEVLQKIRNNFRERCRDVGMLSKVCKDKNSVAQMLGPFTSKLKELSQQMEYINERARKGELSNADVQFAEQIVRQGEDVLNRCAAEIARIDMLFEEEVARREREMNLAAANCQIENSNINISQSLQQPQVVDRLPETLPNEVVLNAIETETTTTDSSSVETVICEQEQEGYMIYQQAKQLLKQNIESKAFREFIESPTTKKFRFECQKAINIPINTISAVSGSHLLGKYCKLQDVLTGKSSPKVNQYPQGPLFCKNLLARNIVSQGETLVSSKSEAAFGIAAVTLALMIDFPDFAELLKAHFYTVCPYLIPFFPTGHQGQTNEEYYIKLGYKCVDGVIERHTKFLTRMSGIMKLYAALIITDRRRGVTNSHPLGLPNAWRWLAATINIEVQPQFADICATLILDMLEIVGNALWNAYPRQCLKLVKVLQLHYYPQVQNCSGVGGGPIARLEKFLNDCITTNSISLPDGHLPLNFW